MNLYFVEYEDLSTGYVNSETWSQAAMDAALNDPDILIFHIELAWGVQKALGLVQD